MTSCLFATRDFAVINSFINDPAVLPHCGFPSGTSWADCSSRARDPDIVFVTDGMAAMMCFHRRTSAWEKHNLFRAGCRGRAAIDVGIAMLAWARATLNAAIVIANTPIGNRPARWFNRQIGMKSTGFGHCHFVGPVEHFRKDVACR